MSKKDDKKKAKGKGKGKDKKSKAPELAPDVLTLARHTQARTAIKTVRSYAGLIAFAIVTLLSLRAGAPLFDAWMRGLLSGVAAVLVAWAIAVSVWRHLAMAEIEAARRRMTRPPTTGAEQ